MQSWELLAIYFLSIKVLLVTMMCCDCSRCVHDSCPHNKAQEQIVKFLIIDLPEAVHQIGIGLPFHTLGFEFW